MSRQKLSILGVTGSIGEQALKVVDNLPEELVVSAMSAGDNWQSLASRALIYKPSRVAIASEQHYHSLKDALWGSGIEVSAGDKAIEELSLYDDVDTILGAIVGFAGLMPTIKGIEAGKKIALANKETLVVAGEQVSALAKANGVDIIPVDSEHSAIFQCMVGERSPIEKIVLTASGGPFFGYSASQLREVTIEQALNHPRWKMGSKITIDSATLMNKGLEVIEAAWLFGLSASQIDVVVHPQSIIHSMVQFADGAFKAQLGSPDMMIPIQYALTHPYRANIGGDRLDFVGQSLDFMAVDKATFPALDIAYNALERGGNTPCVMNGANEEAVGSFLRGEIRFNTIWETINETISRVDYSANPSIEDYIAYDALSREVTKEIIKKVKY